MKKFITAILFIAANLNSSISISDEVVDITEEWTGTLQLEKRPEIVTFDVTITDDNPVFKRIKYADKKFEFSENNIKKDKITFTWKPGKIEASCSIKKEEKKASYAGTCKYKNSEKTMALTLIPPQVDNESIEEPATELTTNKNVN